MSIAGGTSMRRHRGTALAHLVVASVLGCAVVAGCAGPGGAPPAATTTSAPAATTYSSAVCSAAADFQTSANAVSQLDATKVGTNGVRTAMQNLVNAGRNLATATKAQFAPQVATLEQALGSLQTTIGGLTDQNSLSAKLGAVTASVAAVEQAAKPILDTVRTGCPALPTTAMPTTP